MDVVNVRQLKNNPSEALRCAAEGPVLVMKGDQPTALIIGLEADGLAGEPEVRLALAAALYSDGALSLGRAARLAGVAPGTMVEHLSRLGMTVGHDAGSEVAADVESLVTWLASS